MIKKYERFLEKNEYEINFNNGETNYNLISNNRGRYNRLQHLSYQIENDGSPLQGEKIAELLLGAVNLNKLDFSFPFVDIKVIDPIEGVTELDELISVKTSRDKNNLRSVVNYVNGFKVSQIVQFGISKIGLKLFKTDVFKNRFAIKTSSIIAYYKKVVNNMFGNDLDIYIYALANSIFVFKVIKDFLDFLVDDKLKDEEKVIITSRDKLYSIISICLTNIIDRKFNKKYSDGVDDFDDMKNKINNFIGEQNYNIEEDIVDYNLLLPLDTKDKKISYCVLYFDVQKNENEIVLNLQKTIPIKFGDLLNKSIEFWKSKGNFVPKFDIKTKKEVKNIYFKYNDIIDLFSTNEIKGDDVFGTHIKIIIKTDYDDRDEDTKKLYVKVINNIKGIENDGDKYEKKLLIMLNNYLDNFNNADSKEKEKYIKSFSNIIKDL